MSQTYTVKQGDHISSIAADHGFANYHTIWDDGGNSDLAADRDAHVLAPGDTIQIPDRTDKQESRATGATHPFQVDLKPLFLRVHILDLDEKPIAGAGCDLKADTDTEASPEETDGSGFLLHQIGRNAKSADLVVHIPPKDPTADKPVDDTIAYTIHIGNLNPKSKLSGQQARLNNLGYFAGYTLRDIDEFIWAAEEFECDHINKPVRKKRPSVKPAPHDGEDAENTPPDPTGLQDATLVNAIVKQHGI